MVDGKAKLMREDYCDGLGDCLPACPTNAISFEEREAAAYDEDAVKKAQMNKMLNERFGGGNAGHAGHAGGCPGSAMRTMKRDDSDAPKMEGTADVQPVQLQSQLSQWPVQIKLVPVNAPYFDGANLLVAADCTAYAYADFHRKFIKNRVTLIGCPKLDEGDYTEKLTEIISQNDIKSLTIVRMEVPCCGGIENAAKNALKASGKFIPWQVVTVNIDGTLKED